MRGFAPGSDGPRWRFVNFGEGIERALPSPVDDHVVGVSASKRYRVDIIGSVCELVL